MKKFLSVLICLILFTSVLSACMVRKTQDENKEIPIPEATPTIAPGETPEATPEATPEVVPDATSEPTPEPTPAPTPVPTASANDLALMETLLIGASADTKEAEVANWTDEEFIDVMYSKLNNSVGDPLFESLGLTYSFDDGTLKFDLKQIQALAKNMFNREIPLTANAMYAYVSGESFCIMPADGFMTKLEVQSAEAIGQYTVAKGVIAEYGGTNGIAGLFEATLQKNDQYPLGYTVVSLKSFSSNPRTDLTVTASSTLKDNKFSYAPENVLDNDLATAWVEGVTGLGQGQWIKLSTKDNSKMNLSSISFALGYQDPKDFELLYENSAPTKIRVECENGFSKDVEFHSYDDVVIFDSVQKTSWVKITILEASEGTKFDDTCISEIRVYEFNN